MKRLLACILVVVLFLTGCNTPAEPEIDGVHIKLSDEKITVDGKEITNDSAQAVYSAKDIVFYLEGQDFRYGEGTKDDEHSQAEADSHTVVHITKPGKYVLSGKLSLGQIAIDLGEDAEENPEAVVTLVLNGVDVTCTVAPAVIFYNVYECGVTNEETATKDVDTSEAGAKVIIADGTENNINGSYVAKIYKSYELNEDGTEVVDSKKLHKYDAAFYSKKTMNINGGEVGDGVLSIKAENEGLDSELHLTINGGIINITSGNDGINTNEDNVSVTTVNGGTLNILCDGSTGEGDGIDSNGWLVINGGTVNAQACATSGDAGIDSDKGIYINGGRVIASGNMLDHIAGGEQTYAVFNFASKQKGDNTYTLKNADGKVIGEYAPENDFNCLIIAGNELSEGDYTFWQGDTQLSAFKSDKMQGGMPHGEKNEMPSGETPEDLTPPERPEGVERPEAPNGERPQMPDDEMQKGEIPEMPEGFTQPEMQNGERPGMPGNAENMIPPDNMGEEKPNSENSTTFIIIKGGNQFANVGPVAN